ncbi:Transmembrane protein [Trema orientale]|uniref:Transmembrane protein n=1 Tax=Trema orientale TaxID=63057 RepID=A0A2P5BL65_TREOI|nr:Transmembrane protein [Trema orientale]
MDHMASKENGLDFDLESGGEAETSSEQEQHEGESLDSGDKSQKKTLSRLRSGHFGRFILIEDSDGLLGTSKNILSNGDYDLDRMVSRVGEKAEGNFVEKKKVNEKRKKTSFNKKHPKPPRPPGGPSLDEADMKFVKEISDHARLRHKNRERLKALKKMKATKAPSSNINLIAMIITIIFCLVIIFQGNIFLGFNFF